MTSTTRQLSIRGHAVVMEKVEEKAGLGERSRYAVSIDGTVRAFIVFPTGFRRCYWQLWPVQKTERRPLEEYTHYRGEKPKRETVHDLFAEKAVVLFEEGKLPSEAETKARNEEQARERDARAAEYDAIVNENIAAGIAMVEQFRDLQARMSNVMSPDDLELMKAVEKKLFGSFNAGVKRHFQSLDGKAPEDDRADFREWWARFATELDRHNRTDPGMLTARTLFERHRHSVGAAVVEHLGSGA